LHGISDGVDLLLEEVFEVLTFRTLGFAFFNTDVDTGVFCRTTLSALDAENETEREEDNTYQAAQSNAP
jgi:hypothetical protein